MVARLGEIALERGLERVEIPFVEGQRNRPALLFLQSLGVTDAGGVFRFPAAQAAEVAYHPGAGHAAAPPAKAARRRADPARIPYARIATELRDPEQILARIRATSRARRDPARGGAAAHRAGTRSGRALGRAAQHRMPWASTKTSLNSAAIRCSPCNFSRACARSTRVDLSLEVVYSGEFTVAELAKAIELKEIEQAGGDYQELLEELDGLSDEEVRALLAEEQDAS